MNARFGKHHGIWHRDGTCIVYNLQFVSVYHALTFLEPYPPRSDYVVIQDPVTGDVRLEPEGESEATFEFGPLLD